MSRTALAFLLLAAACARREDLPVELPHVTEAELAARARDDFRRACAPCHGAEGRGSGSGGAPGERRAPDLTRLAERMGPAFSYQYVVDVITGAREVPAHGRREMPVWHVRFGRVDTGAEAAATLYAQRRLNALADYVVSLQVRPEPSDGR
jgi:mono/diheme cytochrome c family protein